MFPFSINKKTAKIRYLDYSSHEDSSYELVTFDKEMINLFAAKLSYCQPHWHAAAEFIYVIQGSFTVTINEQVIELKKGGMLYIQHDEIHSLYAQEEESMLLTIQFSSNLFNDIDSNFLIYYRVVEKACYLPADVVVKQALLDLVEYNLGTPDITDYCKMSLIYHLLSSLHMAGRNIAPSLFYFNKKDEKLVKEAIEFINQHYNQELRLSDMAEQAGVSYHYFSKLFKKVSGYNFKEYLTTVRVNKAKFLLKSTQVPITEISYACGFTEHKLLISAFKKICNMTPTKFRKEHRQLTRINAQGVTDFSSITLTEAMLKTL